MVSLRINTAQFTKTHPNSHSASKHTQQHEQFWYERKIKYVKNYPTEHEYIIIYSSIFKLYRMSRDLAENYGGVTARALLHDFFPFLPKSCTNEACFTERKHSINNCGFCAFVQRGSINTRKSQTHSAYIQTSIPKDNTTKHTLAKAHILNRYMM